MKQAEKVTTNSEYNILSHLKKSLNNKVTMNEFTRANFQSVIYIILKLRRGCFIQQAKK